MLVKWNCDVSNWFQCLFGFFPWKLLFFLSWQGEIIFESRIFIGIFMWQANWNFFDRQLSRLKKTLILITFWFDFFIRCYHTFLEGFMKFSNVLIKGKRTNYVRQKSFFTLFFFLNFRPSILLYLRSKRLFSVKEIHFRM